MSRVKSPSKISDYVDPAVASGVSIICPHCHKQTLNTRHCVLCGGQIHPPTWSPPVPLYESLSG